MLRSNGKFLYVITGSHYDFASHVANYAIGEDWKDLFDIVIFFARKPSFFVEKRPFWRLDGANEVESFRYVLRMMRGIVWLFSILKL